jgi:hypothetical protein
MNTSSSNSVQPTLLSTQPTVSNYPYDGIIQSNQSTSFRLFYQNVNEIYKANSWNDWKQLANQAKIMEIDTNGLTEVNIKWNPKLQHIASSLAQQYTKNCQMNTSSHSGFSFGSYQPGGTSTIVLGNSTGRILTKINDPTSMGR